MTNPQVMTSLRECTQNMFNLTIGMGNLSQGNPEEKMDYATYVPNYEEVMTVLIRAFNLPLPNPQANPGLFQVLPPSLLDLRLSRQIENNPSHLTHSRPLLPLCCS